MVALPAEAVGDLQEVTEEVALGVAYVGSVQPHVTLVEEPVELQPGPAVGARRVGLEPSAVQERAVDAREVGLVAPVPGDVDLRPPAVVELVEREGPPEHVVGDVGPPRTG